MNKNVFRDIQGQPMENNTVNAGRSETMIRRFNVINDEITSLYHQASLKLGFADSEMVILYLLCDYGMISQRRIIEITGMSKQTVSSSISRMENAGWLLRGTKNGHRREITLTESGENLIRNVLRPFIEQEESIFSDWTEDEREIFLKLNRRYRDKLRDIVASI